MKKHTGKTIIVILILVVIAGAAYWYFFFHGPGATVPTVPNTPVNGFTPTGRTPTGNPTGTTTRPTNSNPGTTSSLPVPVLRLLSATPVGGYGASTTASTTFVRWIDRGRGNVYQIDESTNAPAVTLSNTVLPRMYESDWNANLTAFIGSLLPEGADSPTTVHASLLQQSTSTASTSASTTAASTSAAPSTNSADVTPFQLKGSNLPDNIIGYAASPRKDKLFFMTNESGVGVGYVSTFDGKSVTQIFTTPLTEVNVDWPETNTIAITTKATAGQNGYLYLVNAKTGVWRKAAGPLTGLSAVVSHDAKFAIVSWTDAKSAVNTSIYNLTKGTSQDAIIRTLADKCAWGNFYTETVYCGVPSQASPGLFPDDWYRGSASTIDRIWQVDADTSEVHLVSSFTKAPNKTMDTFNLGLDQKDGYLFFMNKTDLSLWSLDLVSND